VSISFDNEVADADKPIPEVALKESVTQDIRITKIEERK